MPGLALATNVVSGWPKKRIEAALQAIFASSAFDLDETTVYLTGPWRGYLELDPELQVTCARYGIDIKDEAHRFLRADGPASLILCDGLSGWIIASKIAELDGADLILLHLDDHADMMPTLLSKSGASLVDPETSAIFDPANRQDWVRALTRGTVSIGSYLTPLFHWQKMNGHLHIRHLRPTPEPDAILVKIVPVVTSHSILDGAEFASIQFGNSRRGAKGSYKQTSDVKDALADLPDGKMLVHIDLDYFLNDLNGMPDQSPARLSTDEKRAILSRMDQFFDGLKDTAERILHWIIATSPGFCSARHWSWLLDALSTRLSSFMNQPVKVSLG
ncbi:MAG: hypothetical protein AAGL89_17010 [Pseudomonadota bacterium]